MKRIVVTLLGLAVILALGFGVRAFIGAGTVASADQVEAAETVRSGNPAWGTATAEVAESTAAPEDPDATGARAGTSATPAVAEGGSSSRAPTIRDVEATVQRPGTAARAGAAEPGPRQPDPARQADAAAILRSASAAYEKVSALRADFVMDLRNPLLRQTTTSRGTLYQRDPDRLLLRFSDPEGDVIVSDGRHLWVYYPSVNPQQVIRTVPGGGAGGLDLRSHFVGDPVQRFEAALEGREAVDGRPARVLTLVPRERGAGYSSLKVWIDIEDHLVRRFEIMEENGSVRRFDLNGLQVNPRLSDDLFTFSPPSGARVVDR